MHAALIDVFHDRSRNSSIENDACKKSFQGIDTICYPEQRQRQVKNHITVWIKRKPVIYHQRV